MDRGTIKALREVLLKIEQEIDCGLRHPLLDLHGDAWEQAPDLIEDCKYATDELSNAQDTIARLRNSLSNMENVVRAMHKQWQQIQALTVPSTIGEHVKVIVDRLLTEGQEIIEVDHVRQQLQAENSEPRVKNPAAVLASILARDGRLERIDRGRFRKKIDEENPERSGGP